MATVTQLASGQISSGGTITLTGVSCDKNDLFVVFSSSYSSTGISTIGGNYDFDYLSGSPIVGNSPDLWVEVAYGIQQGPRSNNMTLSYSSSAPAAGILFRVRPDSGKSILTVSGVRDLAGTASTSRSITTVAYVAPTSILIGGYSVGDDTYFTDTDTTNGSWSSVFYIASTAGNDLAVFGQSKIVTAAGSQTYGGTWANLQSEYAGGHLLLFYEVEDPHWGMRA